VPFQGFPSAPLYSLKSAAGWRSFVLLVRSALLARRVLGADRPDAIFSTGGYSAGPVMWAAEKLRIPLVVHESNSVPGRANRRFGRRANAFTTVFRCTPRFVPEIAVTRTGQPIRRELRAAAASTSRQERVAPTVLVLGGSQGSEFLNELVPQAASHGALGDVRFVHSAGPNNIETMNRRLRDADLCERYDARAYLGTDEMVRAYRSADVVVARSGGTLAEIALFGLPSVLVPLPSSADDHQHHNAEEFVDMSAATLLPQPRRGLDNSHAATAENLALALVRWLGDEGARERAADRLKDWDVPDAAERIVTLLEGVAVKG
jgi:UDP-N-acetylglucosamine--N-acetylmuramyl-(pentapeptide) pyrophosphoryl-undecaprenol N-acetylglucosamine transferase